MGQRRIDAAKKDAQIMRREKECALDMERRLRRNDAAARVVQILSSEEACAFNMGQSENYAAEKGVQIKP